MQLNPIFYLKPAQLNVNVEVTVVGKNVILSCEWLHEVWENVCVLDNKPRCNLKTFTVVTLCHRLIFPLLVIKTISWYNKGISRVMWEKMGNISELKKTALIHPVCITKLTWDLAQSPVVFMLSCQVIRLWALTVSIWFLRNSQGKCWKKIDQHVFFRCFKISSYNKNWDLPFFVWTLLCETEKVTQQNNVRLRVTRNKSFNFTVFSQVCLTS